MTATILQFRRPDPRFSTCTGKPSAVVASVPAEVTELVQVDGVLAIVDELTSLSYQRLDHLPFGSPMWTDELEHYVGLVAEGRELERIRERIVSPGLRLVKGGGR